jgi:hypothetical protein
MLRQKRSTVKVLSLFAGRGVGVGISHQRTLPRLPPVAPGSALTWGGKLLKIGAQMTILPS